MHDMPVLSNWQMKEHVFIPVLPDHMMEFIQAPTPFIMGVIWTERSGRNLNLDEKENHVLGMTQVAIIYNLRFHFTVFPICIGDLH